MVQDKKLIFIIGATGAQGIAVIDALSAPTPDGKPSPYTFRALTRDPESERAKGLAKRGVELVTGAIDDLNVIRRALDGCYGAYINTDSFMIGEAKEVFYGIRIFEIAKQTKTMRHFIWSSLEPVFRESGYNQRYYTEHYTGKSRVGDWLKAQPSEVTSTGMSWSMISTGPYMDMLFAPIFGPWKQRDDGTFVFVTPLKSGHIPMVALADIGFFARHVFDHRSETSAQDLRMASDLVDYPYLIETFTKVTGQKAEAVYLTYDEWADCFYNTDIPVAGERTKGDGSTTWKENFRTWYQMYGDDLPKKDMDWVRRVNPGTLDLEKWMRKNEYTGKLRGNMIKDHEDRNHLQPNLERIAQL